MSETASTIIPCEVFVLGGGPAGSTIATLLAERGWQGLIRAPTEDPAGGVRA